MCSGGPTLFWRYRARESKEKSVGHEDKRARIKAKKLGAKETKREYAIFPPFAAAHWKPSSRVQIHSAKGKASVMSKVYASPCYFSMPLVYCCIAAKARRQKRKI